MLSRIVWATRPRLLVLSLLLSTVALAAAAPTDARADKLILLRSYAGAAPTDAEYYVDFMLRLLGRDAPLSGRALRRRVEDRLSSPAGVRASTVALRAQVKDGRRLMIEGAFKQAAEKLEQAKAQILARAAEVASDQGLRKDLHAAQLLLAHAYLRQGESQLATERVSEVIRSFPDRELSLVTYSPELVSFYKKVRRELDRQPRGTLTVTTRPAGCMVFVNERYVGLSPTKVVDMYPGRYRVYVQRQELIGRVHLATVDGNDHQLSLDFGLDRVLRTERYVGFGFANQADLDREEVRYAAVVARAVGAPLTLLMGLRQHQGRKALTGTVVSADTGRIVRSGLVALEPAAPAPAILRSLGQFLVEGKQGAGVVVRSSDGSGGAPASLDPAGAGAGADAAGGTSSWIGPTKWVALGVAVAALAAGITLIALDGSGTCDTAAGDRCKDRYETLAPGVALTATGGAAALTAGLLFYLDSRRITEQRAGVSLLPAGPRRSAGLTAMVRF